jgi:hypothetical protein
MRTVDRLIKSNTTALTAAIKRIKMPKINHVCRCDVQYPQANMRRSLLWALAHRAYCLVCFWRVT